MPRIHLRNRSSGVWQALPGKERRELIAIAVIELQPEVLRQFRIKKDQRGCAGGCWRPVEKEPFQRAGEGVVEGDHGFRSLISLVAAGAGGAGAGGRFVSGIEV